LEVWVSSSFAGRVKLGGAHPVGVTSAHY
jgi:hypothetical protein